ncbi:MULTISPECIES: sensor histidine kinase [Gracilibacillus]|uniref:sensor histidine kinase n=1 Tax=Gracilibacillus TaxID=74385 RepID=UPI0008268185|nr:MULTISPECIES: HAMP domain-containing sensor histidine kinase [Gracilibacillus]
MKLRTKFQLILTGFILVVVLLINSAIYLMYENQAHNNEMNRLQQETANIMSVFAENTTDNVDINELLKAFLPANGMIRIISEEASDPIYDVSTDSSFTEWPYEYTTTETQNLHQREDGLLYMQVSKPLIWEDGSIVTLQVSEALYETADTLQTLQIVLLATTGVLLIPTLLVAYLLAGFMTKPIRLLTNEMKDNPKNGKWEKLRLKGKTQDEITEMQKAYNAMIDRVEENIGKQERFVSDASHELRTPLSVITSYAELLQRRAKDRPELLEEATETILSESERMKHLTEQMLTLAKNQNQADLLFEEIDLSQLIRESIRSLSTTYQREIHYRNKTEADLRYSGDKHKIHQAIYILIDNACKYSDDKVLVETDSTETTLTISITDCGEGLSEQDKEHIFERFYRVDKARSRKAGGTGLGLAICYQIVHGHGGTITIDSAINEGSTFTIHLPR